MLFSNALTTLLLACGVAAVPAGKTILGYRTVVKAEADKINAAGAPVWDGVEYGGGKQLGPGVYTSTFPGAWTPDKDEWVCVIYVDTRRLNDVSKVWIEIDNPVTGKEMWWDEDQIKTFIKAFPWKWNPERSLRMAWIDGIKDLLQLLIPPELVAASGSLGLSAVCKEKISDLPDRATVNYDDWQNNIGGQRGPQRY